MIGPSVINIKKPYFINKVVNFISMAVRALLSFRPGSLLSDDIKYIIYFHRSFKPGLYCKHVTAKNTNCLFCCNLIKSEYHRYCLICSKGTYDNCYLPLPDILYEDTISSDSNGTLPKPWYFMKTCSSFERLPKKQYFRNLHFLFSSITIHNYEALEGLENGILYGSRPCYICASIDYDLYRRCKRQGDYDVSSPCPSMNIKLEYAYDNHRSSIRPAG